MPALNPILLFALTSRETDAEKAAWDILTALRGPDEPGLENEKFKYTCPIRAWVFPTQAAPSSAAALGGIFGRKLQTHQYNALQDTLAPAPRIHFHSHIFKALQGISFLEACAERWRAAGAPSL